jgi:hypothetical protein
MALTNRNTLKNYFKKGGFAKENHFVDLIDSTLNSVDDRIQINKKDGLKLNTSPFSTRLISFFKKTNQENPEISFNLNHDDIDGFSVNGRNNKAILKFSDNGKIGINKNKPEFDLDLKGTFSYEARTGNHSKGHVLGDGNWHNIISNLDGLNSFEINASIKGKVESGRYCILHAHALSAFGGRASKSNINSTAAYYGIFFNKIVLRWTGEIHNYNLQIKTRRHYGINPDDGEPFKINYNISKLV